LPGFFSEAQYFADKVRKFFLVQISGLLNGARGSFGATFSAKRIAPVLASIRARNRKVTYVTGRLKKVRVSRTFNRGR
jgi:hypothetical protein